VPTSPRACPWRGRLPDRHPRRLVAPFQPLRVPPFVSVSTNASALSALSIAREDCDPRPRTCGSRNISSFLFSSATLRSLPLRQGEQAAG